MSTPLKLSLVDCHSTCELLQWLNWLNIFQHYPTIIKSPVLDWQLHVPCCSSRSSFSLNSPQQLQYSFIFSGINYCSTFHEHQLINSVHHPLSRPQAHSTRIEFPNKHSPVEPLCLEGDESALSWARHQPRTCRLNVRETCSLRHTRD